MKMQRIDGVKIHHMMRGIDDESFQPQIVLVLTVPLTPVCGDMTQNEEDRLIGQMMREAMDKYNEDKKNG